MEASNLRQLFSGKDITDNGRKHSEVTVIVSPVAQAGS